MISALALSPSLDVTYVIGDLAGIQRPLEVRRVGGGKALNAARVAAVLGAQVRAVAVLGAGSGDDVAADARAHGVDVHVVAGEEPTRMCVSILAAHREGLTEIYERAVPLDARTISRAVAEAVDLAARDGGWWLVSGGLPSTIVPEAVGETVALLREAGSRVAVDSHGDALAGAVAARPDLVKVNRAEAVELLGFAYDTPGSDLVTALRGRAGGLAVVTDGADGAWAAGGVVGRDRDDVTDGTVVVHARLDGHFGRFPVGSGDSFLGAMLVMLDTGGPLVEAVVLGVAAGAANAQEPGAGVLSTRLVRKLAREVRVEVVAASS